MTWEELLCKLGIHRWYLDSALLTSAERCVRCGAWKDPMQGAQVERVRAMVADGYLNFSSRANDE